MKNKITLCNLIGELGTIYFSPFETNKTFIDLYNHYFPTTPLKISGLSSNAKFIKLNEAINMRCWFSNIARFQEDFKEYDLRKFIIKFFDWYFSTCEKYEMLLDVYTNQLSAIKALKGATSSGSSINKVNDVPQDVVTDLDSDTYLTAVNRSDVENENKEAPLEAIVKIQNLWNDTLDSWVDDFRSKFVLEDE